MYARKVPTADRLEIIDIQVSNWTDIEYAIVKIYGHDFYEDSYSRAKVDVNGMTFYGTDMLYGNHDWVTVNVTRPLEQTTLFEVKRISVEPEFSEIIVGDITSNNPSQILIKFKDGIQYTEDIKVHLLHYLKGNYELAIVEYSLNTTNISILDSITVELPLIQNPMHMELHIEPILQTKTIFNRAPFKFILSQTASDTFLRNETSIAIPVSTFPKIYSVSPLQILPSTTHLNLSGSNLTSSLTCSFISSSMTSPVLLFNSSFGQCEIQWSSSITSEVVEIADSTNVIHTAIVRYQENRYYYVKDTDVIDPNSGLSW